MKPALLITFVLLAFFDSVAQSSSDSASKNLQVEDTVYTQVEVEAVFPGGKSMWNKYLRQNMRNPNTANGKVVVTVQFFVDNDGRVRDIKAISGPFEGGFREEAVRLVKKGPSWRPANQNGRPVKSFKQVSIEF